MRVTPSILAMQFSMTDKLFNSSKVKQLLLQLTLVLMMPVINLGDFRRPCFLFVTVKTSTEHLNNIINHTVSLPANQMELHSSVGRGVVVRIGRRHRHDRLPIVVELRYSGAV